MAMVRLPTTSCWCLSIDTRYSTKGELKRIASWSSKIFALDHGYKIHAIELTEDHFHLFLEIHPSTSLSNVVQYLKGGSSYRLFKLHPELKKRYWGGNLWSSGKFFRSVGNVTADTIKHYINESQGKSKRAFQSHSSRRSGQLRLDDF
jgi:putative transposase